MPAERLVAIHQPNFLPWLGYFDKIVRADVFVILDDAQFSRGSPGTWTNRVKLLVGGQPWWLTVPVERSYSGMRTVAEMRISNSPKWPSKALSTIQQSYGKAPFFDVVFPTVSAVLEQPTQSLSDYNINGVRSLLGLLELSDDHLVLASSFGVATAATERLADLVEAVDGTAYLTGGGADYQDDDLLTGRGIAVRMQDFQHPAYHQRNAKEFVPGLSAVDLLFHVGPEQARALLSGAGT